MSQSLLQHPNATRKRNQEVRRRIGSVLIAVVMVVLLIWTLFPFYWAFISSIKDPSDNYGNKWLPFV